MARTLRDLLRDQRGQGITEYGLILALVAVLLIAGFVAMRGGLQNVFNRITGCLNAASQGQGC